MMKAMDGGNAPLDDSVDMPDPGPHPDLVGSRRRSSAATFDRLPLASVRTFAVVARLLSITRAADELNVTPSAVSHQIKLLEKYLDTALFRRDKNKLQLTPVGQQYLTEVSQALSLLAGATKTLKAPKKQQTLRIGTTPSFALLWLMCRLPRFTKAHPDLAINVTGVPDPTAAHDPFDVTICYGSGRIREFTTEPLGQNRVFPICKGSFLEGEHRLKTPADLERYTLLDSADESYHRYLEPLQPSWGQWLQAAGLDDFAGRKYLYFTPRAVMHSAVAAGLGVGLSRSLLAVDALTSKRLAVPFGPVLAHAMTYNLVYPSHHGRRKDIAAFRDWIHAEAETSTKKIERMLKKYSRG